MVQQVAAKKASENAGMIALVALIGVLAVTRGVSAIPDAVQRGLDSAGAALRSGAGSVRDVVTYPAELADRGVSYLWKGGFVDPFNNAVDDVGNAASTTKEYLGGLFTGDEDEESFIYVNPETGTPIPIAAPRPSVITQDFFGEYF